MPPESPRFKRKTSLMHKVEALTGQPIEETLLGIFNGEEPVTARISKLGISTDSYYNWLFQLRGEYIGMTKEEREEAIKKLEELYSQGVPLRDISRQTRMSIPTMKKYIGKRK